MAASIALAAVALAATASAAYPPDSRADIAPHPGMTVLTGSHADQCLVVVDLAAPSSGNWAAPRPSAQVASAIVFGVERAQVDPFCLALAFRDGRGWGALMSVAEVVWRASMMPPWTDAWDMKSHGSACAAL